MGMIDDGFTMTIEEPSRKSPFLGAPFGVALVAVVAVAGLVLLDRLAVWDGVAVAGLVAAAATAIWAMGRARDGTDETVVPAQMLDTAVERFADTLSEPCMVVNERAVLVYRNRAALTRFPRARPGDPLAFTLRNPELVEAVEAARASGQAQRAELHLTVPNETWYRISAVPYRPDDAGEQAFIVITLYDFTEQKRIDTMRADFIANASHELRTPLTSLMGFIETLQGPAARDEASRGRFLGIMGNQAERMSGLIDDLLSLSRIELRQHVKPTSDVNLSQLLREVVESLEARLAGAQVEIALTLPEQPVSVVGDRQELFEVVENLADNAIKYGGEGTRIEIALEPASTRTGAYHAITVADDGPGIAEEHVPRLTERFYRVDAESSRKKKGTGLGLAIVKHIVNRHHGQMTIRSKLGQGTRVEILLPR